MGNELKTIYSGKMVSDVDISSVKTNDYLKAVNIRNGLKSGVITNYPSNTLSPVTLPSNSNRTAGTAVSSDDHKVYSINYNEYLLHTIVETDTITNISIVLFTNLTDSNGIDLFPGFGLETEISSAVVINGGDFDIKGHPKNKLLIFTYDGCEPRCINIGRITPYLYSGSSVVYRDGSKTVIANTNIASTDNARYIKVGAVWYKTSVVRNGSIDIQGITAPTGSFTDIRYSATGVLTYSETLLAKAPPLFPVISMYFTDPTFDSNNLRGDLYQFIYSYEYTDYEQSVWSVTSNINLPVYDVASSGTDITKSNAIKLTVRTGDRDVRKIRIGYRRLVLSPNDYYEAIVLDKDKLKIADNTTYDYVFYNNSTTRAIPFAEINNIDFDRVPLQAGCLEVLNNGSLALADITEGYDLEPVDISGSVYINPAEGSILPSEVFNTAKANSKYKVGVIYGEDRGRRTPVSTSENSLVITEGIGVSGNKSQKIAWKISSTPPAWATWYAIVITKNLTHKNSYYGVASRLEIRASEPKVVYANIENLAAQERAFGPDYVSYSFVKGDRFKWLKSANETGYLAKTFDSEILDTLNVLIPGSNPEKFNRYIKLRNTIDVPTDLFTSDAEGNLTSQPLLFEAYTPKVAGDFDNVFFHTGNVYPINNPGLSNRNHAVPNGIITNLDCFIKTRGIPFLEGDVSSSEDSVVSSSKRDEEMDLPQEQSLHVVGFYNENDPGDAWNGSEYIVGSAKELKVTVKFSCFVEDTYTGGATPATFFVIQKDRGAGWEDQAYVRCEATWDRHGDPIQVPYPNQVVIANMSVSTGNRIRFIAQHSPGAKRVRGYIYPGAEIKFESPKIGVIVEDFNYDDFRKSSLLTLGTPTIVDNNFRRVRRKSTVYHTDPFIPNTNINGLNRIFAGYFKDYDLNHGAIKRMISRGNYLIAIKESQTTNIPVGVTIISNASGATQLGLSTELLNDEQPYAGGYGISNNSTGLVDTGKNIYLIDAVRGSFVRLGLDGYQDIGMQSLFSTWITNKCSKYKSSKDKIKVGYDFVNKEVIVVFKKVTLSTDEETLVYCEIVDGFTTFLTLLPDHVCHLGSSIFTFKYGYPYIQNSKISNNVFFGTSYRSQLKLVFNENYPVAKIFRSMIQWGNRLFSPKILTTESGASTLMDDSLFEIESSTDRAFGLVTTNVDGKFLAPIPMDINSEGGIIDGDPMRGKNLIVDFETTIDPSLLEIQGIQINYSE